MNDITARRQGPDRSSVPVDGHVHLYSLQRAGLTLDGAAVNFGGYGGGRTAGCIGVLLLTQTARERVFEEIGARDTLGRWTVTAGASENESLILESDGRIIVMVCGRQIRCEQGLEVAALGTTATFPDGLPFGETIDRVLATGAVATVPWGFGKWSGRRGVAVKDALRRYSPDELAVGDNGGRAAILGVPGLIRYAAAAGYRVLSGSDPFPCGDDYRRVGSFGFFAGVVPGTDTPWRDLRSWLRSGTGSPAGYGAASGLARFVVNQAGIRLYNRRTSGRMA